MRLLMLMTLIPKLLSIPFILFYVRKPEDLRTAFILHIIPILIMFFSLNYIYSKKFFNGFSINFKSTINELKKDFPLFLSNISGKVYGLGTTMILANFVSPEAVGAYVGADKLRIACQYIITPVEDVLFPKINQLFIQKSKNLFLFIKTSIISLVGLTFLIFLFVNLFGSLLCKILFPENWTQIFLLLKILSPIIFISAFITLLGQIF